MIQKFQFPDNQLRMFLVENQVILIIKTEYIVARKVFIREQLIGVKTLVHNKEKSLFESRVEVCFLVLLLLWVKGNLQDYRYLHSG